MHYGKNSGSFSTIVITDIFISLNLENKKQTVGLSLLL